MKKGVDIVIKTTKYCNLRCSYCYEYNELGNKRRMSLDNLRALFQNVRSWAINENVSNVEFVWHGGEPLLLPLEFYKVVHKIQKNIFGAEVPLSNVVQSNLTVMSDRHIEFLKDGEFFDRIGVSFDVYGDRRVDTRGKLRTEAVLRNMQKLIDNDIPFSAICVLGRSTLGHVRAIYHFYDRLQVPSRFLVFFVTTSDSQVDRKGLTNGEIIDALKAVFAEWLTSERATPVEPIGEYVAIAVASLLGAHSRYDRRSDENMFLVNVDGNVWGVPEAYDPKFVYGNIFQGQLDAILASPGREKALVAADERQKTYCRRCPYFGPCSGFFVANATPDQQNALARWGCLVHEMVDHIVDTLNRSGIRDKIMHSHVDATKAPVLRVGL
jgi:uncharacterized protein